MKYWKMLKDLNLQKLLAILLQILTYLICFCYVKNTTEQQRTISLFLLNISETTFIALAHFICGFYIGRYVSELMRSKATIKEKVKIFFLNFSLT